MKSKFAGTAGSIRSALLFGIAMPAMILPSLAKAQEEAQPATAAQDDVAAEEQGNEIVITATKREQTLQDVPVAVSVTTAETIERAKIRDLSDLQSIVPALRVGQLQSSANTNFFIRGFGNGANNAGIEPSVGVFVDGVYRSRTAAQIGDLPDVQRIEVLRGPQSTLFGKNASAGVISIVTRAPQFKFGGNVEASYGNYNAVVVKGVVTGPVSDTIAVSLAGGINKRDGYITDLGYNGEANNRNRWFVRGQALFQPSDAFKLRLIADYDKIDETCCSVVNLRRSGATSIIETLGGRVNDFQTPFADTVYSNFPSSNDIKNYGLSGQMEYKAGPLTLTSITAYRKSRAITNQDSDFTSADLIGRNSADVDIGTFTQELRIASDLDGPFNFLLGGYYFDETINQGNQILFGSQFRPYGNALIQAASGGALNVTTLEGTFGALENNPAKYLNTFFRAGDGLTEQYKLRDKAYSLFGNVDFEVTDRLTLTAGFNYTNDRKDVTTNVVSTDVFSGINLDAAAYAPFRNQLLFLGALGQGASPAGAAAFAAANQNNPAANPLGGLRAFQFLPPFLNLPNAVESGKTRDSDWSYTLRAAYDATDTVNVYLSYATGFKASSFNLSRDSRPLASDLAAIRTAGIAPVNLGAGSRFAGPEDASVYEFGLKANWGLVSANLAVFKQTIKGFQSNIFTGTGFALANAGKQSTFGIEFDGMVKPVDALTFNVSFIYLDPKYDSFPNSALGDATGRKPAGLPGLSATFGAQYEKELTNGDTIILRGDYHYDAPVQIADGLPGFIQRNAQGQVVSYAPAFAAARPFRREVSDANASLTYAMENGLELSVWGRNLLDSRNITTIFDSVAQSGSISGYTNQPRTYGVGARFKW
ncbi:TonB-dependent receptor [Novosphingobium sp.]|uniref:TonB-dependent receptor n=1 Tax=Novosphingobium sp. TaxID=1874826 RepID=UPI0025CE86D4|nr:TonB-dependent receptor [Novosphingobium sp.]